MVVERFLRDFEDRIYSIDEVDNRSVVKKVSEFLLKNWPMSKQMEPDRGSEPDLDEVRKVLAAVSEELGKTQ